MCQESYQERSTVADRVTISHSDKIFEVSVKGEDVKAGDFLTLTSEGTVKPIGLGTTHAIIGIAKTASVGDTCEVVVHSSMLQSFIKIKKAEIARNESKCVKLRQKLWDHRRQQRANAPWRTE